MPDWLPVAVRFALYLDLGLAFGWPLFCLYGLRGGSSERIPAAPVLLLGAAGLLISGLGFLVQLAAMSSMAIRDLEPSLIETMIRETAMGWAFAVRMLALLTMIVVAIALRGGPRAGLGAAAGAVALATLAWGGHAGAAEGRFALLHVSSDLLHLWSAGLWLGALFGLLSMLAGRTPPSAAHRALEQFSIAGTFLVGTLIATGIVNAALLVGPPDLPTLFDAAWSQLLLAKLLLFGLMLALASANRFRLTPGLRSAIDNGDTRSAVTRLRASLAVEAATAVVILAVVAWLGTLAPPGSL